MYIDSLSLDGRGILATDSNVVSVTDVSSTKGPGDIVLDEV